MSILQCKIFSDFAYIAEKNFNDWCKENNCPIVRGINGKLLTGEVYYCEEIDKYAQYEDDLYESKEVYEYLCTRAEEEGILDDDQPDWVSDNWDMLDIYEVDLDKEYLDKETNRWTKR